MSEPCAHTGIGRLQAGVVFVLLAGLTAPAQAMDWTVSPFASVSESWSDNLDLEPEEDADSGFVTTLSPGVVASGSGRRLRADLSYGLNAVFEHGNGDSNSEEVFHDLTAGAEAELLERTFFLDASARASQSLDDLAGAGSADVSSGNDNLRQNFGIRVSPRLENRFRGFATSTLRYAHERIWFEGEGGDERVHRGEWSLVSGSQFRRTRWSAQARYEDVKSTDDSGGTATAADGTLADASFTLGYAITPRFEVNATGGYEKNDLEGVSDESELAGDQEGAFWDVGIRWQPNRRLALELGGGKRFFGRSLRGRLEYNRRRLSVNVSYRETLADNRSLVLEEVAVVPVFAPDCPQGQEGCSPIGERVVFRTDTVDGFFISRQLQSTLSYVLERHAFVLSGFRRVAEFQTGADGEQQLGASLDWIWTLGPATRLTTGGRYVHEKFDQDSQQDDLWQTDVTLSRRIGDAFTVAGSYRHQRQNSSDPGSEFTENAVIATATLRY